VITSTTHGLGNGQRRAAAEWWRRAVFYEIYIRSFQDSNDDGIGDLNGIIARLDYLSDLGVGAIWITPFYPSPQVDFGYDIADHEAVDPMFGTLADFDRLVAAAHARGIRVIIDVVLNHTSSRHPWFQESRSSRSSAYRDWYVWRDGAGGGRPPNNWESAFGGPAWTYDDVTDQWYYHFFYSEQPDLNWRNPAVERRLLATLEFWLNRGVDGFRLDAVNTLFEDLELRDNPALPEPCHTITGVYTQEFVHNRRLPEVHDALRRVRAFVEERHPDALLISEAYVDTVADLVCFYGDDDEMHLPFNFFIAQVPALDAAMFRRAVEDVEQGCGERWPSFVLNNHDIARSCDRFEQAESADAIAKLLAALLLTLRGTPFVYYGEEVGMRTEHPASLGEVRDPVGRIFWPQYKGRDGARRPMSWDGTAGAGFTRGTPWLRLSADSAQRNVRDQRGDPGSILAWYRALLHLRRGSAALTEGRYQTLGIDPDVFAYAREHGTERLVIVLNMANAPRDASVDGLTRSDWRVMSGTHRVTDEPVDPGSIGLAAFEALLLRRGV
jgi:alpha-glucosidase